MRLDLAIPNNLDPLPVHNPLRHNLVPPDGRPEFGPQPPVNRAQEQNTHAHNREDIVRIPIGPDIPISRRDKRHNGQEGVDQEKYDRHGQPGAPAGIPVFGFLELQVDEPAGDEAVDPGAGVRVQVDDEVVGRSGGRREQDDDCY